MDARHLRAATIAALLVVCLGANYRTSNFVVQTADARLAERFGKAAEKYRHDLAIEWLGDAMPDWAQPCSVTVQVGENLGAGGATTFMFDRGEVFGWRMNIQGSAARVEDSVLPHEITHMILATHFRCPVPRWADEGAATSVECASEKAKHKQMLNQFLRTGRGIAFNQMFAMRDYPADVMPLYAQAHALTDYLIQQGGRRKFVTYVEEGMRTNQWAEATLHHYGIRDLGALQTQWVGWVAQGCPAIAPPKASPDTVAPAASTVATASRLPRPEPNLIYRVGNPAQQQAASPIHSQIVGAKAAQTAEPSP